MDKTTTMKWGPIIFGIIIGLVILYFIFRDEVNRLLGISFGSPSWVSCKKQFYVKLKDGKTQAVFSSNEGTESAPILKYYKNDVTFTTDGITGATTPIEITEKEFKDLCRSKYDPPYEWYKTSQAQIVGH